MKDASLIPNPGLTPRLFEEFASYAPQLVEAGAGFLGGCCGTTPEFIRATAEALSRCTHEDLMQSHEFTLILSVGEVTDKQCNALYEAGCDDGTISTSARVTRIDFCRDAPTLDGAIRSAIGNVNAAGFQVARVEIEADAIARQRV